MGRPKEDYPGEILDRLNACESVLIDRTTERDMEEAYRKELESRLEALRPLVRAAVACYEAYKRMELPGFDGLEETLKMVAAIDALPDDVVEWAREGE